MELELKRVAGEIACVCDAVSSCLRRRNRSLLFFVNDLFAVVLLLLLSGSVGSCLRGGLCIQNHARRQFAVDFVLDTHNGLSKGSEERRLVGCRDVCRRRRCRELQAGLKGLMTGRAVSGLENWL